MTTWNSLNRNLVESSALKGEWGYVRAHLKSVELSELPVRDRAYGEYWLGVCEFYQGSKGRARELWLSAMEQGPDAVTKRRIQSSLKAVGGMPRLQLDDLDMDVGENGWVIQLGLFSIKSSAHRQVKQYKSRGIKSSVRLVNYQGRESWVVYMGPFDQAQALREKHRLQRKDIAAILKPISAL